VFVHAAAVAVGFRMVLKCFAALFFFVSTLASTAAQTFDAQHSVAPPDDVIDVIDTVYGPVAGTISLDYRAYRGMHVRAFFSIFSNALLKFFASNIGTFEITKQESPLQHRLSARCVGNRQRRPPRGVQLHATPLRRVQVARRCVRTRRLRVRRRLQRTVSRSMCMRRCAPTPPHRLQPGPRR
jgi:hypothetical protein